MSANIKAYKSSQRTWIKDIQLSIEAILRFIELYCDLFGIRVEFEGLIRIVHRSETEILTTLVKNATKFIYRLLQIIDAMKNNSKGFFEKELL